MSNHKDWQESAIHDLQHTNMTREEIAAKYGRSRQTIDKLKLQRGIVREGIQTRRGPKRRDDKTALSREHVTIGLRLLLARKGDSPRAFSQKLGMSLHMLLNMEAGHHDFTLSQLHKICALTGLTIEQILQPFDKTNQQRSINVRQ